MNELDWNDPAYEPLSNGPIRTVTGPATPKSVLNSDRTEMEYLLAFPFHALDHNPWPPLTIIHNGIPVTIYRPIGASTTQITPIQTGNEAADAYCTVIRLSVPVGHNLCTNEGWTIIKRLLEWIRVKCRHYWLLHGIAGFGATYRGSLFTREGQHITQQNIAVYGPNVIVNPLTRDIWLTLKQELEGNVPVPLADSLYCDALLSIVAGDTTKALLEAGVAMEVALTKLLVDFSNAPPSSPPKANFIRSGGDRNSFTKKLREWTLKLGLDHVEKFTFDGAPQNWQETATKVYKLRNGVAHSGTNAGGDFMDIVKGMYAAATLLEYCRAQRLRLGLEAFSMPPSLSPWKQVRLCHNGNVRAYSNTLSAILQR